MYPIKKCVSDMYVKKRRIRMLILLMACAWFSFARNIHDDGVVEELDDVGVLRGASFA
jgi:hypothetical protein